MILVDSNILMYAAGAEHANKLPSVRFLERIAEGEIEAALDAEVLQEVLHRYRALNRWEDGKQVYDLSRRLLPIVFPITVEVVDRARELLETCYGIAARDALHAAVVEIRGLDGICSYDRDFDLVEGIDRIEPERTSAVDDE